MKHTIKRIALTSIISLSMITCSLMPASAGGFAVPDNGPANGRQDMMGPMQNGTAAIADTAGEIVSGTTATGAAYLTADTENAVRIVLSDEEGRVTISESGTYIVTGTAGDGSITVAKGTAGVVLILEDLDLTSASGAPVSVNKESEVQIVVSGNVTLTDAENPDDKNSADAEIADAYDGAAIKIKAGASVYLTGSGTLTVNGIAGNGIKTGDSAVLIIDGEDLSVDITAANDGINAGYDLTIAGGTVNISASDDALHADRILTIGTENSSCGPTVTVRNSAEGLEGTVVNIHSGSVTVNAADDAINAANSEGAYENELVCSINVTGGTVTINSRADGLDSNGNVNLTGGTVTILSSANNGGDAGVDYDGQFYLSADATLNNVNGIAGPDMARGQQMAPSAWTGENGQTPPAGFNGQDGRTMGPGLNHWDGQSGRQFPPR